MDLEKCKKCLITHAKDDSACYLHHTPFHEGCKQQFITEIEKLQAEIERLKSAVKQVANKMEFFMQIELIDCADILRQALAESEADAPKEEK